MFVDEWIGKLDEFVSVMIKGHFRSRGYVDWQEIEDQHDDQGQEGSDMGPPPPCQPPEQGYARNDDAQDQEDRKGESHQYDKQKVRKKSDGDPGARDQPGENVEGYPSNHEYQQQLRGFLGIFFHCDSNYFVASLRLGERKTTNHADRRECSVGTEFDLRGFV